MRKLLLSSGLFLSTYFLWIPNAFAIDGFYLGGHVGHVALSGDLKNTYSNGIGFGVDLGMTVNPSIDVLFQSQWSPHSGGVDGLKVLSETLSANIHFYQVNDFEFTVQAGPGFYFYKTSAVTESQFGLHTGLGVDVLADEHLRVGLDWRYHFVFNSGAGSSSLYNYWTTMMRVGYIFGG